MKSKSELINNIVSHFFSEEGSLTASYEELEQFYGLEIADTSGMSMEEYEEVYNRDDVITDRNAFDKGYMEYTLEDKTQTELKQISQDFSMEEKLPSELEQSKKNKTDIDRFI